MAYHMARMSPEKVEKVVIASSGVGMKKGDEETLVERAKSGTVENFMLPENAEQMRNLARLSVFRSFNMIPDFFLNDFVQSLYAPNRKEKLELLKGITLGHDQNGKLSPLSQDVLLVWGKQDQIFPLKMAQELKEIIGEKVRLEVMEDTSHVPQIEDSGRFNDIVFNFLSGSSS